MKSRIGDSDLINVRFGPLCGLKSDISRGLRSANSGCEQMQQTFRARKVELSPPPGRQTTAAVSAPVAVC